MRARWRTIVMLRKSLYARLESDGPDDEQNEPFNSLTDSWTGSFPGLLLSIPGADHPMRWSADQARSHSARGAGPNLIGLVQPVLGYGTPRFGNAAERRSS